MVHVHNASGIPQETTKDKPSDLLLYEFSRGQKMVKLPDRSSPQLLKVKNSNMKVIILINHPKDTESYFHFYRMSSSLGDFRGSWNEFFRDFQSRDLYSAGFIELHLGSWRFRETEHPQHVLFVAREELQRNLQRVIRKVAKFCDKDLSKQTVREIAMNPAFELQRVNPTLTRKERGLFDYKLNDSPYWSKQKVKPHCYQPHDNTYQNSKLTKSPIV